MRLPQPEQGLVISYAYLWARERRRGADEGRKTRPCIIMLVPPLPGRGRRVLVSPITHSKPSGNDPAVELPPRVARALGLDQDPQWVVVDEVNRFLWPGFDLRPIGGRRDEAAYGFIPPRLFDRLRDSMLAAFDARRMRSVDRD